MTGSNWGRPYYSLEEASNKLKIPSTTLKYWLLYYNEFFNFKEGDIFSEKVLLSERDIDALKKIKELSEDGVDDFVIKEQLRVLFSDSEEIFIDEINFEPLDTVEPNPHPPQIPPNIPKRNVDGLDVEVGINPDERPTGPHQAKEFGD